MNKPLVAAVTGVAFGIVLTGSLIHMRMRDSSRTSGCHRAAAVHRVVVVPAPTPAPEPVVTPPQIDETPSMRTDSILSEAQTEYVNGNYAQAVRTAKSVQKDSPVRAWRIIGSAACNLHDIKLANDAFRRLDAPGRQYMVYVCQRNGMSRDKHGFSISE